MTQERRFEEHNRIYSDWHRRRSTGRYLPPMDAYKLSLIDLDCVLWCEWEKDTKKPVALIETARDTGQSIKPTTVLRNLAEEAGVWGYCVLYTPSDAPNPAALNTLDIKSFRVREVYPRETGWRHFTPKEYAEFLRDLRRRKTPRQQQGVQGGQGVQVAQQVQPARTRELQPLIDAFMDE